jgi:uncharacterized SAM-binding protein YcdF (DUF218 family)
MRAAMTEVAEHTRSWPARRGSRTLAGALIVLTAGIACGLIVGFFDFAGRVAVAMPPSDARADGIVALTGGTSRIDEALQLLAAGRANRLLISGVNPSVSESALAATLDQNRRKLLGCCVDLGHEAQDTAGNAREARDWADAHGFSSLIVVTSGYHIDRSMAELSEAMPGKRLIAFPVSNPDLHLTNWWSDRETLALLLREYGKLLWAEARRMVAARATVQPDSHIAAARG